MRRRHGGTASACLQGLWARSLAAGTAAVKRLGRASRASVDAGSAPLIPAPAFHGRARGKSALCPSASGRIQADRAASRGAGEPHSLYPGLGGAGTARSCRHPCACSLAVRSHRRAGSRVALRMGPFHLGRSLIYCHVVFPRRRAALSRLVEDALDSEVDRLALFPELLALVPVGREPAETTAAVLRGLIGETERYAGRLTLVVTTRRPAKHASWSDSSGRHRRPAGRASFWCERPARMPARRWRRGLPRRAA